MHRLKKHGIRLFAVAVVALILMGVQQVQASQIPTLFSTGVDASGNPLPDGSIDPHYTLSGGTAYVIGCPACVGWVGNTGSSSWISPDPSTFGGGGPFTYHTSFDLTGFNPNTAKITGMIAADDQASIYLNGIDVFDTVSTFSAPWSFFENFSITSGFINGINTLDIYVPNDVETPNDGPTGLQLDVAGTASVPEPSTVLLVGLGLATFALIQRRLTA